MAKLLVHPVVRLTENNSHPEPFLGSNLIVNEKDDFATVMALSGHKTMSMLKRYTHTQETAKRAAVRKLEKYVKITTMDTYLDTQPVIEPSADSGVVA